MPVLLFPGVLSCEFCLMSTLRASSAVQCLFSWFLVCFGFPVCSVARDGLVRHRVTEIHRLTGGCGVNCHQSGPERVLPSLLVPGPHGSLRSGFSPVSLTPCTLWLPETASRDRTSPPQKMVLILDKMFLKVLWRNPGAITTGQDRWSSRAGQAPGVGSRAPSGLR